MLSNVCSSIGCAQGFALALWPPEPERQAPAPHPVGKKAGEQPEEAPLSQVTCAMEKQDLSRGHGGHGGADALSKKWTLGGGKVVRCLFHQTLFPGSVHPPPILTLLCAPSPQQQGSSDSVSMTSV